MEIPSPGDKYLREDLHPGQVADILKFELNVPIVFRNVHLIFASEVYCTFYAFFSVLFRLNFFSTTVQVPQAFYRQLMLRHCSYFY